MYQSVVEQMQSLVRDEQNEIHTAIPGIIVNYDNKTGRATVRPKGKIIIPNADAIDYPQLNDVPVVFPYCSQLSAGVAFPIETGDSCLLVFCEQALDSWLGSGDTSSELKYSLTNAIAIPGLAKLQQSAITEATEKKSLVLFCGKNKVCVSKEGIDITGDVRINGNLTVSGVLNNGEEE